MSLAVSSYSTVSSSAIQWLACIAIDAGRVQDLGHLGRFISAGRDEK